MHLRSLIAFAILLFSLTSHAAPLWRFEIVDPAPVVSPTDTITIYGRLTNDVASAENFFTSAWEFASFGGVPIPYLFDFTSYDWMSFIDPTVVLAPGESFEFSFGILTPENGYVAPGFYEFLTADIGFYGEQQTVEYTITVIGDQSVPEPSIMLLLIAGVAGSAFVRRNISA